MYAAQTKHTLENLGITRKYKGYYYLSDAVEIVNINETALLNVGKQIYSPISLKYSCNSRTIERNIRTVILNAWKNNKYKIENIKSFELADIFDCGQCFRWNKQDDGSYTGVFKENVMNVQKNGDTVIFKGICNGDTKEIVQDYFDLNRNYEEIKEALVPKDYNMIVTPKEIDKLIENMSKIKEIFK